MLRNIFVALLLMAATQVFSQNTIHGVVRDTEGQALIGASVSLSNSMQGTITNDRGEFSLKNSRNTNDSILVRYLGYNDQYLKPILGSDESISIVLNEKQYQTQEVFVYGSRAGNRTPMAFSNIDKEKLKQANTGNDITYMLSTSPSVVATSETGFGLGYTAMRIRGTDATRINVTMNGIPLNDGESQGVYWVNMPDFGSSLSNVQIQRGVGTSSQGAAAFGATVNFQTDGLSDKPYAEYQAIGGSFNTLRNTVKVGTGLINDHFSFDARLSKLNADGYIKHSFSDHSSIYLTGAYHAKNSLLRLTLLEGKQKTGISWWGVPEEMLDIDRRYNPAGVYFDKDTVEHYYKDQTDNYHQTHYQLHFSQKLNKYLSANMAVHYTRGSGYYEQYKDDNTYADYGIDNPVLGSDTLTSTDLIRQKWMKNDFYGATATLLFRKDRLESSLGGGWNYYGGDHFGNILWMEDNVNTPKDYEWYFNTGDKTDWNIFTKANYQLTSVISIFGDVQYRHIDYTMNGSDDDLSDLDQDHHYNFVNPKTGVFLNINSENRAYVSYAVSNREPTRTNFKEANGDPEATPKAETLCDLELGYNYFSGQISAGINLYYMDYRDQLVPTGEKSSVGYDIMTNVDKSFRRGIEIEAAWQPFDFIRWDMNLTLSQNKIQNFVEYSTHYTTWNDDWEWYENEDYKGAELGETDIAYSPSVIGSNILNIIPIKNLQFSFITKYVGKQYIDNTSNENRKIDPYLVNDIKLEYELPVKFTKNLSVMCQVNNVFNNEYINNGYGGNWYEGEEEKTWAYYYPQAGIHFFGGLTLKF